MGVGGWSMQPYLPVLCCDLRTADSLLASDSLVAIKAVFLLLLTLFPLLSRVPYNEVLYYSCMMLCI